MSLRIQLRPLLASPAYSLFAVTTLAIGLAAIGLMFAVVNTVLLRPLPFAAADRLVTISQKVPFLSSSPTVVTADEFQSWQHSGLFESAALLDAAEYTLAAGDRAERIYGASVTPDFFRVFGISPILGAGLVPENGTAGHERVIVLSHELWMRRFAGDPGIIGKTVRLSGSPVTIVGVMPPRFDFPRLADVAGIMNWAPPQAEFWVPFVVTPEVLEGGNFNYYVVGRLRPGIDRARAAAQFRASAVHIFQEKETKYPQYRELIEKMIGVLVIYVTPLKESMASGIRDVLWMLLGAVGLLLALVLFNLGNLLLTRNAQRFREYTVRQALGATRWQLFRQSFGEQAVLVGAAALFATLFMLWGIQAIRATAADRIPRLYELQFSLSQIAVLLTLAFLTAVVFGALSQLMLSDRFLNSTLQSQSRLATGDRQTHRLKALLMSGEIALSLVLLVGAGLLLESFSNVMRENPGFNAHNVLTVRVSFDPARTSKPAERLAHTAELLNRLRSLPGVQSASVVSRLPLTGDNEIHDVRALGRPVATSPEKASAEYRVIDAAYFHTMQIPLLNGRAFRPDDPPKFAMINDRMAKNLWPHENAIGKQFADGDHPPVTVIGVVGDVHNGSLEKPERMQFYRLISADPYYADNFVIRTATNPAGFIPSVARTVWQLNAGEPVTHTQTMEQLRGSVTLERRFETGLITAFAVIALLLSALGLFGVASLSVVRRTREFGIRLSLGARPGQVLGQELWRMSRIALVGLTTGLLVSLAAARLIASLLYGVTPWSARIYGSAALVLTSAALLASWFPARRASRTDPAEALRSE